MSSEMALALVLATSASASAQASLKVPRIDAAHGAPGAGSPGPREPARRGPSRRFYGARSSEQLFWEVELMKVSAWTMCW